MVGIVVGMAIGMAKWKLVNVLLHKILALVAQMIAEPET
jgi:hypothetical protein